ncbi:unnamed protein product [Lota lota]
MALNVPGVVVMAFFYLMVLGTGIWASFKSKRESKKSSADQMEMTLLGNRGINLVVGMFTMTATWIGGGFFITMSEAAYTPSLGVQEVVLVVIANVIAFFICGLVFTKPMRDRRFVTMLDPFYIKYGKGVACLFTIISLIADLIWVPATLISLGAVMSVILDVSYTVSVWISAAIAVTYTLLGGLYSVAYTDIIQLILMFLSAWLCVPFVLMSPAASGMSNTTLALNATSSPLWLGAWEKDALLVKVDTFLFLAFGSLAYQCVHQRILSASSSHTAKLSCFAAAIATIIFAIPPAIIGSVAVTADWNKTSYGSPSPLERGDGSIIFPIALNYLTPPYIAIIGISAVAAAVMSSTDSALLSAATTFSSNIYKNILRPQASQREMNWVVRVVVVLIGIVGTSLTAFKSGTLAMWYIGVAMTYVFMFPQLICVLFFDKANGYGSIMGFVVSLALRLLCGWPRVGIPAVLRLPGDSFEDGAHVQRFPVNTLCMLCSMACILTFSYLTALLLDKGIVPEAWDLLHFLKMPRKLPSVGASNEDKNRRLEEKDPSEPMIDTTC